MIKLYDGGVYLLNGNTIVEDTPDGAQQLQSKLGKLPDKAQAAKGTMAYGILSAHNTSGTDEKLKIKFDAMASHDITFVGIVQTAKASGLTKFPLPYVLTNCHNTLCAVGGTINEDDHMFGLSAAKKYGGIYVPPHMAVIHMYMREMMAGCGKMILGSDSHTRYGALGTMAIGEGGGELVKQLLCQTYDINYPRVIGVYLTGKPQPGVGPQDIALAIIGATFANGYVKNSVMEFVGDGVGAMSTDYRCGVDVMTTETACLSSIWRTDEDTKQFLTAHGRGCDYKELKPADVAYYDGMVYVDLSTVKPMIAMPFHPSNTYEIETLKANLPDILHSVEQQAKELLGEKVNFSLQDKMVDGKLKVDQGVIAGCAGGTYSNIMAAADILRGYSTGNNEFSLSVYPSSQPVFSGLTRNGTIADLIDTGAVIRSAFCGPCFGAGDVPANNALSVRHTTRNFPNREGSKPGNGQIASVALMDARSIAATARSGGFLTAATELDDVQYHNTEYTFDDKSYRSRVYNGWGKANEQLSLTYGPNIVDWPEIDPLPENLLLKVVSYITDPVTTTDELIPSGETSSFRSNPLGLAEFTLSRKDPAYVGRAKAVQQLEKARAAGNTPAEVEAALAQIRANVPHCEALTAQQVGIGSTIYAVKPGDGSAREQAASCQRVLGGSANIVQDYATKRYRSNLMNWGMVPFHIKGEANFATGDYIFVPNMREALLGDTSDITAYVLGDAVKTVSLYINEMTPTEKQIVLDGCLINYNRNRK